MSAILKTSVPRKDATAAVNAIASGSQHFRVEPGPIAMRKALLRIEAGEDVCRGSVGGSW
jgi:hypothetical protein